MIRHAVIVGNGVAGFSAARCLRREDPDLTITLLTDEAYPFYMRSRLKEYLCGAVGEYEMILESRNLYRRDRLNLLLQTPVSSVDTENREVVLGSGERMHWDRLLVATGRSPGPLPIPGQNLRGVFCLRTLADADAIRSWMAERRRAVILGEGIVSMQLAESLARLGAEVDYVLMGDHFWPEGLGPSSSAILESRMRELGVRLYRRNRVERITGCDGRVEAAELADGRILTCDLVGHGCSFRPNIGLLAGSGIRVDDGVVVGPRLETNIEGVFAAGDVVSMADTRAMCHEFPWQNGFAQGETAAINMLGGDQALPAFANSVRTEVCGLHVAVIGRGSRSEQEPGVTVDRHNRGSEYRRLVYEDDLLVGAILMGDVAHADILERYVSEGISRSDLADGLLPALTGGQSRLHEVLHSRCPICTDDLELPAGTLIGTQFRCEACHRELKLTYSEGRIAVVPVTA